MSKEQTVKFLVELESAVDNIIEELYDRRDEFHGEAINWGDLHCLETKWVIYNDGSEGPEVVIEEASPDSQKFCFEVADKLLDVFGSVIVMAEW